MVKKNLLMTMGAGIAGFLAGIFIGKKEEKEPVELQNDKYRLYFSVLEQWMKLRECGGSTERYFLEHGYHRIGIYGIAHLGNHLIAELKKSEIEVVYGIDRRADLLYAEVPVYGMDDEWERTDAIIVTPVYDYSNIKKELDKKGNYTVISLEEVVSEAIRGTNNTD